MSKYYVQQAMDLLSSGLDPFLEDRMKSIASSVPWTSVLQELDKMRGKDNWIYSRRDPSLQLRMLTERLGGLGYPFDEGDRNRTLSTYGSVLRIVRNRLSHGGEFEVFDALQAVDTVRVVLAHIDDMERAGRATNLRTALINELLSEDGAEKKEGLRVAPGIEHPQPQNAPAGSRVDDVVPAGSLSGAIEWEPWTTVVVGEQTDLDSMRSNRVKENVRSLIEDIAEAEGPVYQDRVARLVGLGFGFSRLSVARKKRILAQIPKASVVLDSDGFVWPEGIDRDSWLIHRTSTEAQRPFEQISPVEIANAAESIKKEFGALDDSEVRRRIFVQFGRKRGNKRVDLQLERGLKYANTVKLAKRKVGD